MDYILEHYILDLTVGASSAKVSFRDDDITKYICGSFGKCSFNQKSTSTTKGNDLWQVELEEDYELYCKCIELNYKCKELNIYICLLPLMTQNNRIRVILL